MGNLIQEIVERARQRHMSQGALALAAGIQPAALSRAKRTGNANLRLVRSLAQAAGLQLGLIDSHTGRRAMTGGDRMWRRTSAFESRHRELAWSNPKADRETLIRQALVRPAFDTLLDAALTVGVEQLERQWRHLLESGDPQAARAQSVTEAMLRSIRHGYEQASA